MTDLSLLRLGTAPDSWGVWFPQDDHQVTWQQYLDELRNELPEVRVQPVNVLRPLALGQVAFGPGEVEVDIELAVERVLRRSHRSDRVLRASGVSY